MSTFAVLAHEQAEEQQLENRSIVAARVRAQEAFGPFLASGNLQERLAWVEPDLESLVEAVADEYGYANVEHIKAATLAFLAYSDSEKEIAEEAKEEGESFEHEMREKQDGEDEDDDEDKWEKPWEKKANKYISERDGKWVITQKGTGKVLSTHDSEEQAQQSFEAMEAHKHGADESAQPCSCECNSGGFCGGCGHAGCGKRHSKVAADDISGDSFQHERVDLPSNTVNSLGDTGAVPTDKGKSGDNTGWSLKPIDVGSKQHPHSVQDVTEHQTPKYTDSGWEAKSETGTFVDVETAMQPEHLKGDRTKTWSGTEGQKDPVTNQALSSKYQRVTVE